MTMRIIALMLALGLAACSGGHGGTASGLPRTADGKTSATATITIPNGKMLSSVRRNVQFVSSSIATMTFVVTSGTTQVVNQSFDASASSPYCTAVTNGRTCSFTFFLSNASGAVDLDVMADDANNLLLSECEIGATVVPGTNLVVPMTLEGVAASATVSIPGSFTFGTAATIPITVTVKDPDGNVIIGSGPFDNTASVQLTLPASVPATIITTPAVGNPTTAPLAVLSSPSTTLALSYAGGATLGIRVKGSLVGTTTTALGTTTVPVIVQSSNAVDDHNVAGTGQAITVTSTRAARGPDGDVYFVGTGGGNPAVVRAHFASGTPTIQYCTVSAISDVAVSATNEVVYVSGPHVYAFSATTFPSAAPCGAATSSYTLPATASSVAADSSGVFVAYQSGFSDPTYGTAVEIASYSSSGAYNGGPDQNPNGSGIQPILTGDPSSASVFETYSTNYGYQLSALQFATTSSFTLLNSGSAGDVNANDLYRFVADPYSNAFYVMDTTQQNVSTGATPSGLYAVSGGRFSSFTTAPQLAALTVGIPTVTPGGLPVVISTSTIYHYYTAGYFAPTAVTLPSGSSGLTNGALGNDGRIWLTDGTRLLSYPGTGTTGP
jgi:hypothetical protein